MTKRVSKYFKKSQYVMHSIKELPVLAIISTVVSEKKSEGIEQ